MNPDLLNQIAVSMIPGAGSIIVRKLIGITGSPEALLYESPKSLSKIPNIPGFVLENIRKKSFMAKAEMEAAFVVEHKIHTAFFQEAHFPQRLNECYDAPVILYYKGNPDLNKRKIVSVVGTRRSSNYGNSMTEKIIKGLAETDSDITIISGLAYGIDIAAHRSALRNKLECYAVLAHGLDDLYPPKHAETAAQLLENGGLITENIHGTIPDAANFVKRNRIVAGMSDVTLVVESGVKGGAMITANLAFSYDREVMAVPGNVGNYYAAGCNYLIKSHKASLIESAEDMINLMNWDMDKKPVQRQLFLELNSEEEQIIKLLKEKQQVSLNNIGLETGLPISKISVSLLNLEMQGAVKSLPGNMYAIALF